MTGIGRETRRRITDVLELQSGTVSLPELQALLPDLAAKEVANGLMQLVRTGVVHSTGTVRAGAPPAYELWSRVSARMRARARARGPQRDVTRLSTGRTMSAERIA